MADTEAETGVQCARCGIVAREGARWCGYCGAQITVEPRPAIADAYAPPDASPPPASPPPPAYPPPEGGPSSASAAPSWQSSLPAPFNSVPIEVLVVCGLMAFAGLLVLWPTLKVLPSIFELLGAGGLALQIGLLLLVVWVVLAAFGAALLVLAWRLGHADRVARGLSYVLCGGVGTAILLGDQQSGQLVLVMLSCFGAIAVLSLVPRVKGFFTGGAAPQGDHPVPVVVARTLVAIWAACITLVGAAFLPLGGLGAKFVVVGVGMLAIGIGAFYLNGRLGRGDAKPAPSSLSGRPFTAYSYSSSGGEIPGC